MTQETVDVRDRQMPLQQRYKETPGEAMITDRAVATDGVDMDPFHGITEPGRRVWTNPE